MKENSDRRQDSLEAILEDAMFAGIFLLLGIHVNWLLSTKDSPTDFAWMIFWVICVAVYVVCVFLLQPLWDHIEYKNKWIRSAIRYAGFGALAIACFSSLCRIAVLAGIGRQQINRYIG